MPSSPPSFSPPLPDPALEQLVRALPKAELHLHVAGAMRWDTVRALHPRGYTLPASPPWLARAGSFDSFDVFREVFSDFLKPSSGHAQAVERHAFEVLADMAAQNVRYAEVIITPRFHLGGGMTHLEVLEALERGRTRVMAAHPIEVRYLYGINRHDPQELVQRELEEALAWAAGRSGTPIAGVDLQGDETLGRPADFRWMFEAARGAGLRARAHAGELCGPDSVRAFVEELGVDHISHGVRAIEDPSLVEELAARGVWLHVCPTSNVLLGLYPDFAAHPLPALMEAGCKVTLNSDDPLLFGTTILDEYRAALRGVGLSAQQLVTLARAGFEASLLDEEALKAELAAVDAVVLPPSVAVAR